MNNLDAASDNAANRKAAYSIFSIVLITIVLGICIASINCFAIHTIYRWYKYIFWGGTVLGALWLIRMIRAGRLQPKKNVSPFLLLTVGSFFLGLIAFCFSVFLVDAAILVSSHKIMSFQTSVSISPSVHSGCQKYISFYDVNVGRPISLCADTIALGEHTSGYSIVTDAIGPLGAKVINITASIPVVPTTTTNESQLKNLSYPYKIQAAILPYIVFLPESIDGNPVAQVKVITQPNGQITSAMLVKSSGFPSWDESVLLAVLKARRIPPDIDGKVPPILIISFRPKQ
ncbi:MAG: TonB C-terminal domain-containing protein [Burkholderiaceae bacterium]|jgi:TonB family protein|nr:TonB C-terminal domain-containing protein [Burkholderiaceae bacterium]